MIYSIGFKFISAGGFPSRMNDRWMMKKRAASIFVSAPAAIFLENARGKFLCLKSIALKTGDEKHKRDPGPGTISFAAAPELAIIRRQTAPPVARGPALLYGFLSSRG